MKGAVLSIAPSAVLVDLTHDIPAHDIAAGAFTLSAAYGEFPAGTILLAVVDPGVGSTRRAIAVQAHDHFFVGPDNGLFSLIYDREPDRRIIDLTNEKYFRRSESTTFDGRDVFAPVAAHLANGVAFTEFGPEIHDPVRLPWPKPQAMPDGSVPGAIIHIDRFGNCVTNLTRAELLFPLEEGRFGLRINDHEVTRMARSYEVANTSEAFLIWGSAGYLEISIRERSAAEMLRIQKGNTFTISCQSPLPVV